MKPYTYKNVRLTSGYLFGKEELNRKITIDTVYNRFVQTGRIGAFDFDYREEEENAVRPHYFWDSDVAKWMEGAAYILKNHPEAEDLEGKIDSLVDKIKEHQQEDGYFNIYFTVVAPEKRFSDRKCHELYCAGHLMEAAVAYAEATGKKDFLRCMEKYADYIYRVFVQEKSAGFHTPGHEEIELALMRMYDYTGKKKYLDLAAYFINARGVVEEPYFDSIRQGHMPVREQTEAVGHAVRAVYLYTGMAMLAAQTREQALMGACRTLWDDITKRKMYVTGGLGSTKAAEAFTGAYDLPNDTAYAETCAAIGLMFFGNAMLEIENNAKYADVVERAMYNGMLSGLSLDGSSFFYRNPLEINLSEHLSENAFERTFPITQRVEIFDCSCCPPNLNRVLSSFGNYLYGKDADTLYVNQFVSSVLEDGKVRCAQQTEYPHTGTVKLLTEGVGKVAVRIPWWCESFRINKPYVMQNGYAVTENDGGEIAVEFDMAPKAVFANTRVMRDIGRVCVMRGPVVYCAEGVDNEEPLHRYLLPRHIEATETFDETFGLYTLKIPCKKWVDSGEELYVGRPPETEKTTLKLIPYNCFANRGETDMRVWLCCDQTTL